MIGARGVGRAVLVCDSHDRRVPLFGATRRQALRASPTEGEPGSIWLGKGKDAVGVVASVPDQPDMRSERLAYGCGHSLLHLRRISVPPCAAALDRTWRIESWIA
jgi:hypothetical protein